MLSNNDKGVISTFVGGRIRSWYVVSGGRVGFNSPVCDVVDDSGSVYTVLSLYVGYFSPCVGRNARVGAGSTIGFVVPRSASSPSSSGLRPIKSRISESQFQRLNELAGDDSENNPRAFAEVLREVIERGLATFNL